MNVRSGIMDPHALTYAHVQGMNWNSLCRYCIHRRCATPVLATTASARAFREYVIDDMVRARRYSYARGLWSSWHLGRVVGHVCVKNEVGEMQKGYFVTVREELGWTGLFFPSLGELVEVVPPGALDVAIPDPMPLAGLFFNTVYARVSRTLPDGSPSHKWAKADVLPYDGAWRFGVREGPVVVREPPILPYCAEAERALRARGEDVCQYRPIDAARGVLIEVTAVLGLMLAAEHDVNGPGLCSPRGFGRLYRRGFIVYRGACTTTLTHHDWNVEQ
ncbi:hypothetical protein GLOTRDRAFT_96507 [Gloeophyllum trabeum ATCC 11539]|uniref:Uncharacterized protein n=1 Tax=Gloeophyllum trabeum (strain ATCC 11539 / FP-39264 / Madison 617) TaxID=670483 RepID=S7RFR3_GLOTA|nr:uncharacterized protein GLOTRDRAFT_96507 [Gloeophyllum trabeum ATCC 11539]EPQ51354.1 hypothetical protein GLOTRDRAFT_96507 [Gloeophyllum trabeum ATCC 11539]